MVKLNYKGNRSIILHMGPTNLGAKFNWNNKLGFTGYRDQEADHTSLYFLCKILLGN